MRRWIMRIVLGLLAVILVAGVGGYWYVRPLLLTGTGYAAHSACAMAEFADAGPDLPENPLVPYLRTSTDERGATSSLLGVLAKKRAWYSPGLGCTLSDEAPHFGLGAMSTTELTPQQPVLTAGPGVENAIATAFGDDLDDDGRARLGTRGIVVMHGGEVVAERYADGFDTATPQLGWSMAKSVTNLLTGRLVQDGGLDVDEKGLRPEWADDERSEITIDDLMRMTSGLSWDETYDLGTPITRMLYLEPDMAEYVAGRESAHPVGEYQQYSSGSTTLLCAILAGRAAGYDMPSQTLLMPLGLESAVMEPDASGTPVCSSYLWATPRDWATIGQFALQEGMWEGEQLLPDAWMQESTRVEPVARSEEQGYAAGWWVNRLPDGTLVQPSLPADTYWASGHDGQRMYVVPSADLVVVRLGFSPEINSADLRDVSLVADVIASLE